MAEFRRVLKSWDVPERLLQYGNGTVDQSNGNLLGHPVGDRQQVAITGLSLEILLERAGGV